MSSSRKRKSNFTTEQILEDFQEYQDSVTTEESCIDDEGYHVSWWHRTERGPAHFTCLLDGCFLPVSGQYKFCSKEHAIRYDGNARNLAKRAKRAARRRKKKEKREKRSGPGRPRNLCLVSGIECRMYEDADKCECINCVNLMKKPARRRDGWMTWLHLKT